MSGLQRPHILSENLAGAFDVMLGRAGGLGRIDLTRSGILWSFSGLILAGLIDMSALSMRYNQLLAKDLMDIGRVYYLTGYVIVALIAYAASLVALYLLCRAPWEQGRIPVAIAVHNWAAPLVSLAYLPLFFLSYVLDDNDGSRNQASLVDLISVFWLGLLIVVALQLLRISLDVRMGRAVMLFVLTTAVSLVTSQGLQSLLGLPAIS